MPTPHISAPDGAFAPTVLMPGDPLRARYVAENFLENSQLVTAVRNVFGYTGTYHGHPVSVMASGMGMPSIGIYAYELFKFYGVENIIRIGSAGSYTTRLKVRDVVLANGAYSESSFALVQSGVTDTVLRPDAGINRVIEDRATRLGIECKTALVHSSDVFYGELPWQPVVEKTGVECVEMESFALFNTANRLGRRAACLLTISDSLVEDIVLSAEERQRSFTDMMRLALESAISL